MTEIVEALDAAERSHSPNPLTKELTTKNASEGRGSSETGEGSSTAKQGAGQTDGDIPDWLKRMSFGAVVESEHSPRLYLETVQPLYQSLDKVDTVFTQERISMREGVKDYSAGWGYRHLLMDNNLMLGVNNFFDYKSQYNHYRTGLGLEAISNALEFRANTYFGLSPKRLVETDGDVKTYERAASGFDVEMGGPLPSLDWLYGELGKPFPSPTWLKVFGGYYRYDFWKNSDMEGWKVRGEIKPFKGFILNLAVHSDNKQDRSYQADMRVNLALSDFRPKSIVSAIQTAVEPAAPPLDTRTLDRVERSFEVQVERRVDGPVTIVGKLADVQLVVRFPGVNPPTTDFNSNGLVDPGEDFELDVLMTNNTDSTSTGISYANAVTSSGAEITINNSADLPDAPPRGTTRTDNGTDMDIHIDDVTAPGASFNVTLDFTADGQTKTLTFGPFIAGSVYHDQVIDHF